MQYAVCSLERQRLTLGSLKKASPGATAGHALSTVPWSLQSWIASKAAMICSFLQECCRDVCALNIRRDSFWGHRSPTARPLDSASRAHHPISQHAEPPRRSGDIRSITKHPFIDCAVDCAVDCASPGRLVARCSFLSFDVDDFHVRSSLVALVVSVSRTRSHVTPIAS